MNMNTSFEHFNRLENVHAKASIPFILGPVERVV